MSLNAAQFRSVLGRFATGVTIVTVRGTDDQPYGMTVSAFSSLSLDPPLVLVCVDNRATMAPHTKAASHFAVSILTNEQEELSRRFAEQLGNRFAGIGYTEGMSGCALIDDALAWLECRIVERHPAGDHVILIGKVENAVAHEGTPLLYYRSGYATLQR